MKLNKVYVCVVPASFHYGEVTVRGERADRSQKTHVSRILFLSENYCKSFWSGSQTHLLCQLGRLITYSGSELMAGLD